MTRVCGSNKTATGHGCMNLVSNFGDHCSAGHLCLPVNFLLAENHTALLLSLAVDDTIPSPTIWEEWHQHYNGVHQFEAPEFYAPGVVVSVHYGSNETIKVWSEGEHHWEREGEVGLPWLSIRKPKEFRKQFPNGELPGRRRGRLDHH